MPPLAFGRVPCPAQTQVGAQKVEVCHDVQSVHGDPGDGDLVGEGDEDGAAVSTLDIGGPGHDGGGCFPARNFAVGFHSPTHDTTYL